MEDIVHQHLQYRKTVEIYFRVLHTVHILVMANTKITASYAEQGKYSPCSAY